MATVSVEQPLAGDLSAEGAREIAARLGGAARHEPDAPAREAFRRA